jgi:hypothetical protein
MSTSEPGKQRVRDRPIWILLFGLFSIIFGLVLTVAALVGLGLPEFAQHTIDLALVAVAGSGCVVCGIGFVLGTRWGWPASLLVYGLLFISAVVEALNRQFVWGIFLDPVILVYLLIPQVRTYFLKPRSSLSVTLVESIPSMASIPLSDTVPKAKWSWRTRSNVLTVVAMLSILMVVPVVAYSVHTVSVTTVTLDIVYNGTSTNTFPWFGPSGLTVGSSMFTWGNGLLEFRMHLDNLGLFQAHTIDSFALETTGFVLLYGLSTPLTLQDLQGVTFTVELQAPDYNFNGPVFLQIQTH